MIGDRYSTILDRTAEMVREWQAAHRQPPRNQWLAAPFGWTEGPGLRWRVSCDVRNDLMLVFDGELAWRTAITPDGETLYGVPLIVDDSLPPNSVILEERP